MPEAGVEPARPEGRGILSPLRLPIPPPGPAGSTKVNREVARTRPRQRQNQHRKARICAFLRCCSWSKHYLIPRRVPRRCCSSCIRRRI